MMTNWRGIGNFEQQLLDFLAKGEGKHYEARDVGDGKVTIGTGFNISEKSVRKYVYARFGVTAKENISKLATIDAQIAETAYRQELDAAIERHDIAALDGIMARRAADVRLDGDGNIPNRRTDFRFHSDAEVIDTLKAADIIYAEGVNRIVITEDKNNAPERVAWADRQRLSHERNDAAIHGAWRRVA